MFNSKTSQFNRRVFLLDLLVSAFVYILFLEIYPAVALDADIDIPAHLGLFFVILTIFAAQRAWSNTHVQNKSNSSGRGLFILIREQAITVAICFALVFLLKLNFVSRFVVVGYFITTTVVIVALHMFLNWWYLKHIRRRKEDDLRVLVIGSGRRARMLADMLQKGFDWGVTVVGFLDPEGRSAGRREGDEILGHSSEISSVLRDNVVEAVVVAVPRAMLGDVQSIIDACQEEGVNLCFMADFYDFNAARMQLTTINNIPLLSFEPIALSEDALLAKRIFDLIVVIAATPVLIPLFALIAISIKLDSKGPVFFSQQRVGLNKRVFDIFKFRSMVPDAEAKMAEIEHLNESDGPAFKIKHDPRITRLGRFLRTSSLDELPQLINVLLGDMSLVGPRPMSIRDVDNFEVGLQRKRFSARPGITCIWQVSGRSDLSFDEWLELDLKYIEDWSFWLDLKILLRTIPTVLKGSGAS